MAFPDPKQERRDIGAPLVTARACFVEAVRHAGVHLGELRLTRSLLNAAAGKG